MSESANGTAGTWRALALALCTLWGNILLLETSGSVLLSAPFATRMASMAFSIVGFVAVWLVARRCGVRALGGRTGLLAAAAVLSALGSFVHFADFPWLPGWVDVAAVAVFSVAFAFLLVACGEIYAGMGPKRSIVCASVSYLLAYIGSTLVAGMGSAAVCAVETLLPLGVFALVGVGGGAGREAALARGDGGGNGRSACADAGGGGAALGSVPGAGPLDLRGLFAQTFEAIPLGVLTAIGITYFAIGSTLAQAGTPLDYFSWGTALAAVLTSVVVMGATLLLHGRVSLASLYKVLMVGQVLAAFLLSEWSQAAQVAIVITFVGVKIVAWTLMAELALLARARGSAPAAFVYAAGCLAGHIGEGVAGVISVFCLVEQGALTIVVVALLVVAAAFLFTGQAGRYLDIEDFRTVDASHTPDSHVGGDSRQGKAFSAGDCTAQTASADPSVLSQATLDQRISELAGAYMLSARETDVFRLWATGHTLKYIQEKLYLSPSTVKTHVRHIYDKTGKHSRAEIVELLDQQPDRE